ncbi:AcrR family transcriptional regulator [Geodermatophilus bullaregiensis]|uniref:TetR/AcrR family transcriptional regulator n=1 Tax=Geodermatophilus bullaregiensis TaxID=1564160 RepID=UPI00195AF95C|nr:TetR/AcrR family transcriptional regulator [Geodermatophilus bullaregiensis]MBM7805643.1 AcrR family transcriptional regulator [Geodermatophilus bullaregiensis]
MARPFRQQVDEGILDRAAALFARRGFAKTSVQDVAAAVGLSKAGLLHHFPSKDALHEAVLAQADTIGKQVLDHVRDLPPGADRDRRAVEILVDVALAHPGLVALMLAPATQLGSEDADPGTATTELVLQAFAVDRESTEPQRLVRVVGALAGLAVLTLAAHAEDRTTAWRPHIVDTCTDALGHRRPSAALSDPHQAEA